MTTQEVGKMPALAALAARRIANKSILRKINENLPAESPMYFYCTCCGAEIIVPESYVDKPDDCPECTTLKERGWL